MQQQKRFEGIGEKTGGKGVDRKREGGKEDAAAKEI